MKKTFTFLIFLVITSLTSCVHTVEDSAQDAILLRAHDEIQRIE